MNKEWRPQNWVNSQEPFVKINVGESRQYFRNGSEQYEAGASAMLSARDKWWLEGVEPIINSLVEHIRHGDYSNGNTAQGSDEGEYLSAHHVEYLLDKWQSLKQSILEVKE